MNINSIAHERKVLNVTPHMPPMNDGEINSRSHKLARGSQFPPFDFMEGLVDQYIYLFDGNIKITTPSTAWKMKEGQFNYIPAHTFYRLENIGKDVASFTHFSVQ